MPPSTTTPTSRSRRTPAVARALASWAFCLSFASLCSEAAAQSAPEPGAELPPRLAIAPDARAFVATGQLDTLDEERAFALHHSLELGARRYFLPGDNFELVASDALSTSITSEPLYEGTLALARQWAEMGEEAFKRLQADDAIAHLERALQNYRAIDHDRIAPEEIAHTLLFLALSYLEDGTNVVRPLELMQEMILLDPSRRILPGYYPDFIVQYYRSARDTLFRELSTGGPSIEEAARSAELLQADYLLYTFALPTPGDEAARGAERPSQTAASSQDDFTVIAFLYDASAETFLPPESLRLTSLEPTLLQNAANRLASRLAACVLLPDDEPLANGADDLMASRGQGRLGLELGMAYASFLSVAPPLQSPFGNIGVGLGFSYALTREFQLVAGLQLLNSLRDYNGLLRDDFTTLRSWLGGRLAWELGPLELGIAANFEFASLSKIRVFTDKSCIPAPDTLCPGELGTRTYEMGAPLLGAHLNPRISLRLTRSLWLTLNASVGYYLSPVEDDLLNLPASSDLGIRYRF
ncbi:hypothetical protein FRC98_19620 [Lujinxingia vulgaris]|uniref:Outer membrane protein beta-barrel domain-containing protein n=1 Tax=Lujinxingia vulgaris TaxID=2600176 RepID=A0A5C6WXB7_9DELT|nr:hypothetical protein [Lujinxingia vulgaris]TXD34067.1 hypothetical protein FRC98_19620 [Lujinxingia vulgaris]